MSAPPLARRLQQACLLAGLLGASTIITVVTRTPWVWSRPREFLFFLVTLSVLQTMPLRLVHGGQAEDLQLEEAFFVPMALLLTPAESLLALGSAVVVGHLIKRRNLLKATFNVGQMVTAAALGIGVSRLLGASVDNTSAAAIAAAVAGALTFALLTSLAVAGIVSIAQQGSFRRAVMDGLVIRVATWAGSLSLGALILLAAHGARWSLPVSLLPLAGLQIGYGGVVGERRERQRMQGLYDATVRIRSCVEPAQVRENLLLCARAMLEAPTARLVANTSTADAGVLRAEVDAEWSVEVGGRSARWTPSDRRVLESLAVVAAGALQNADLFEQVKHQALFDRLTELPNIVLFEDRVRQALVQARRDGDRVALLSIDLDGFKKVNDSLGHSVGDELLQQVAERLTTVVRSSDTVARMGGDEFTVLLPNLIDPADAGIVAQKVLDAFRRAFVVGQQELFVSASIGIALYPDDGARYETLLKNADSAMHQAKDRGRNNYQLYASVMNAQAKQKLALEAELHNAIGRGELRVLYQPLIDLQSDTIVGVEALVRWHHPKLGMVSPAQFIPLAEETGLIEQLDAWVLLQACRQGKQWIEAGMPLRVSTNISGRNFQHGRLYENIISVLESTGFDASLLELEVTESVAVLEDNDPLSVLADLRALGVRVAIDDFGTGYSMLSRLRDFPVNTLKIDRSFVSGINEDDDQAPIVSAVIALAHGLGLDVLAEGVETFEQLDFLRVSGCDSAQGFLFSKPVEVPVIEELVRRAGATPPRPAPLTAPAG